MNRKLSFKVSLLLFLWIGSFGYGQDGNTSKEIDSIYWLQKGLFKKKDYTKARELGLKFYYNPPIIKTSKDSLLYAKIVSKIGDCYIKLIDNFKGIEWYNKSLDFIPTPLNAESRKFKSYVLFYTYANYNALSQNKKAIDILKKAIDVANGSNEKDLDFLLVANSKLVDTYISLGYIEKAKEAFVISKLFWNDIKNSIKNLPKPKENYFVTFFLRKIKLIAHSAHNSSKYSNSNQRLMHSYLETLDSLYTKQYSNNSKNKPLAIQNQKLIGVGAYFIAEYFFNHEGDNDQSYKLALKSAKFNEQIQKKLNIKDRYLSNSQLLLARIYMQANNHKYAQEKLNEVEKYMDSNNFRIYNFYYVKGISMAKAKNLDSCIYYFEKVLKELNHPDNELKSDFSNFIGFNRFPEESRGINNMAEQLINNFKDNKKAIQKVQQLNQIAFTDFTTQGKNFNLNEKNRLIYNKIIYNFLKFNKIQNSSLLLSNTENIENRLAWQQFNQSRSIVQLPIIDSLEQIEFQLRKQLVAAKKQRNTSKTDSLSIQLEKHQKQIKQDHPNFADFSQDNFEITEYQKQISKDEVVLKYMFFKDEFAIFQITKDSIQWQLKPWTKDEKSLLSSHLNQIKNPAIPLQPNEELTQILIPKNALKYQKLTIIPNTPIYQLPFETLVYNNKFLIEDKAVRYSSHLRFAYMSDSKTKKKEPVVSIFAPDYPKGKTAYVTRSVPYYLDGAQKEAKAIEKLFPSISFIGQEATKSQFIASKSKGSVLHMAMHATMDKDNPEFSHFNFPNKERLYLEELYALNIPTDLAVLSACNTGIGKVDATSGIASLQRALNFAGTKATVSSLWEVPDQTTSQIMISFYKHLKKGYSKSKALQKAKIYYLETTKDELLKHPYYWAGFVLYGDDDPITNGTSNFWWYVLGVSIIVSVMLFYTQKSKKLTKSFSKYFNSSEF